MVILKYFIKETQSASTKFIPSYSISRKLTALGGGWRPVYHMGEREIIS